jgi:hypothetical protein
MNVFSEVSCDTSIDYLFDDASEFDGALIGVLDGSDFYDIGDSELSSEVSDLQSQMNAVFGQELFSLGNDSYESTLGFYEKFFKDNLFIPLVTDFCDDGNFEFNSVNRYCDPNQTGYIYPIYNWDVIYTKTEKRDYDAFVSDFVENYEGGQNTFKINVNDLDSLSEEIGPLSKIDLDFDDSQQGFVMPPEMAANFAYVTSEGLIGQNSRRNAPQVLQFQKEDDKGKIIAFGISLPALTPKCSVEKDVFNLKEKKKGSSIYFSEPNYVRGAWLVSSDKESGDYVKLQESDREFEEAKIIAVRSAIVLAGIKLGITNGVGGEKGSLGKWMANKFSTAYTKIANPTYLNESVLNKVFNNFDELFGDASSDAYKLYRADLSRVGKLYETRLNKVNSFSTDSINSLFDEAKRINPTFVDDIGFKFTDDLGNVFDVVFKSEETGKYLQVANDLKIPLVQLSEGGYGVDNVWLTSPRPPLDIRVFDEYGEVALRFYNEGTIRVRQMLNEFNSKYSSKFEAKFKFNNGGTPGIEIRNLQTGKKVSFLDDVSAEAFSKFNKEAILTTDDFRQFFNNGNNFPNNKKIFSATKIAAQRSLNNFTSAQLILQRISSNMDVYARGSSKGDFVYRKLISRELDKLASKGINVSYDFVRPSIYSSASESFSISGNVAGKRFSNLGELIKLVDDEVISLRGLTKTTSRESFSFIKSKFAREAAEAYGRVLTKSLLSMNKRLAGRIGLRTLWTGGKIVKGLLSWPVEIAMSAIAAGQIAICSDFSPQTISHEYSQNGNILREEIDFRLRENIASYKVCMDESFNSAMKFIRNLSIIGLMSDVGNTLPDNTNLLVYSEKAFYFSPRIPEAQATNDISGVNENNEFKKLIYDSETNKYDGIITLESDLSVGENKFFVTIVKPNKLYTLYLLDKFSLSELGVNQKNYDLLFNGLKKEDLESTVSFNGLTQMAGEKSQLKAFIVKNGFVFVSEVYGSPGEEKTLSLNVRFASRRTILQYFKDESGDSSLTNDDLIRVMSFEKNNGTNLNANFELTDNRIKINLTEDFFDLSLTYKLKVNLPRGGKVFEIINLRNSS